MIYVKKKNSNEFGSPLVQVKAKKIIHDKNEKIVKFYDSYLDVKGQSIFLFALFFYCIPCCKKKSWVSSTKL